MTDFDNWFAKLSFSTPKWFAKQHRKVVYSTRVRLARNFKDLCFPHIADVETKQKIFEKVSNALLKYNLKEAMLWELEKSEISLLFERNIINSQPDIYSYLLLSMDEMYSVLINDEDHVRIQVLFPGYRSKSAKVKAEEISDELEKECDIAKSEKLGYLTSCPSNTGSGMRISYLLHIPGLFLSGKLDKVISAASQCSLIFRGVFGEGTRAIGSFCQLSNNITLRDKDDIINKINHFCEKLIDYEWFARERIVRYNKNFLEDIVIKEKENLMNSNIKDIEVLDAAKSISMLKLGVDLGIVDDIKDDTLSFLYFFLKKAHIHFSNYSEKNLKVSNIIESFEKTGGVSYG